ncbi:MAG: hypothetical protein GEV11_00135 [Streptosporangiales bacterium]|nr:hypothetical protein [Streptosporangiales bacterium]
MKDALAVHRRLLERETGHEIVRLRTTALTADDLPGGLGVPRERCVATQLFLTDPGGRATAVLTRPGDHAPVGALRAATGARHLRPAAAHRVNALTDFAAGLICPILLPATIGVFIDRRILARVAPTEIVYTPTGEKRTGLAIALGDLIAACRAAPISLVALSEAGDAPSARPPAEDVTAAGASPGR